MAFSKKESKRIGDELKVDWSKIDLGQFQMGLDVELGHGKVDPKTNVINSDPILTGKIVWAHLNELPDYNRLKKIEECCKIKL